MTMLAPVGDVELIEQTREKHQEHCEHSRHFAPKAQDKHSDDGGLWLVVMFCDCGTATVQFCDKYVKWFLETPSAKVECVTCRRTDYCANTYEVLERIV